MAADKNVKIVVTAENRTAAGLAQVSRDVRKMAAEASAATARGGFGGRGILEAAGLSPAGGGRFTPDQQSLRDMLARQLRAENAQVRGMRRAADAAIARANLGGAGQDLIGSEFGANKGGLSGFAGREFMAGSGLGGLDGGIAKGAKGLAEWNASLKGVLKMLSGGGVVGAISMAGNMFENLTAKARDLAVKVDQQGLGWRQIGGEIVRQLPLIGSFVQGWDNALDLITGASVELEKQRKIEAEQNELIAKRNDLRKGLKEELDRTRDREFVQSGASPEQRQHRTNQLELRDALKEAKAKEDQAKAVGMYSGEVKDQVEELRKAANARYLRAEGELAGERYRKQIEAENQQTKLAEEHEERLRKIRQEAWKDELEGQGRFEEARLRQIAEAMEDQKRQNYRRYQEEMKDYGGAASDPRAAAARQRLSEENRAAEARAEQQRRLAQGEDAKRQREAGQEFSKRIFEALTQKNAGWLALGGAAGKAAEYQAGADYLQKIGELGRQFYIDAANAGSNEEKARLYGRLQLEQAAAGDLYRLELAKIAEASKPRQSSGLAGAQAAGMLSGVAERSRGQKSVDDTAANTKEMVKWARQAADCLAKIVNGNIRGIEGGTPILP